MEAWFQIGNAEELESPALLVYVERVEQNIREMIRIAGRPERLRPHIKTHKLAELIRAQLERGINKFKCATIAEAEMAASCGAPDVLLGYQPVGPNVRRICELIEKFKQTQFSVTVDDAQAARELSGAAQARRVSVEVLLDLDCGQHRTGVQPDDRAFELYTLLSSLPGLTAGGLHAYDGHIHDRNLKTREEACDNAFAPVAALRARLVNAGLPVKRLVAGGTPTFRFHAERRDVECSPGTSVLWDWNYSTNLPDYNFVHAAALLTRVVSKPGGNRVCLDLGHKAVASEMPHPRVHLPELPDAKAVGHSEEHLVLETSKELRVGTVLYGIPWHICPTVALHSEVIAVKNGRAETRWALPARARRLSI